MLLECSLVGAWFFGVCCGLGLASSLVSVKAVITCDHCFAFQGIAVDDGWTTRRRDHCKFGHTGPHQSVARVLRGSVECSIGCWFGTFQAPTLLLIALLPASTLKWSLANVRVAVTGGGEPWLFTAMETIQVACMWRVARRTAGMEDVDPLSDPPTTVSAAPAASTSHAKKIGGAEHDESGVKPSLSESHRCHWAEPPIRRLQQLKTRPSILQPDGTFRALDIPGPPSFEACKACWRVFRFEASCLC